MKLEKYLLESIQSCREILDLVFECRLLSNETFILPYSSMLISTTVLVVFYACPDGRVVPCVVADC